MSDGRCVIQRHPSVEAPFLPGTALLSPVARMNQFQLVAHDTTRRAPQIIACISAGIYAGSELAVGNNTPGNRERGQVDLMCPFFVVK